MAFSLGTVNAGSMASPEALNGFDASNLLAFNINPDGGNSGGGNSDGGNSGGGDSDPGAPVTVPGNLLNNGSVENGLSPWQARGDAQAALNTSVRHSGNASVSVTNRSATWHGVTYPIAALTPNNPYEFQVWVRLAAGTPPTNTTLSIEYQDSSGANYRNVATALASSEGWTMISGTYTHVPTGNVSGIRAYVESESATASYYVDDLAMTGEVTTQPDNDNPGNETCALPSRFQWEASGPLVSPKNGAYGIKDPSVVQFGGKTHLFATINDGSWKSVYLNFTDWSQADSVPQIPMNGTRGGNTVAPQVFYYRPHNRWYNFTQWPRGYNTTTDISDVNSWTPRQDFLQNGPPIQSNKPELDYWNICDDSHCHLFFSRDDGVLYKSKTTRANFPNFNGYQEVMRDNRGNGASFLFEAANVYKVDGSNQYLLLVEAYRTPGYGPRFFRSWTATSLDGPWKALADSEENPFAGNANVSWTAGKWADGISHGEMIRSGYDEYLTIDPCNLQFVFQGDSGSSRDGGYGGEPYKLGILKLKGQ